MKLQSQATPDKFIIICFYYRNPLINRRQLQICE